MFESFKNIMAQIDKTIEDKFSCRLVKLSCTTVFCCLMVVMIPVFVIDDWLTKKMKEEDD